MFNSLVKPLNRFMEKADLLVWKRQICFLEKTDLLVWKLIYFLLTRGLSKPSFQ